MLRGTKILKRMRIEESGDVSAFKLLEWNVLLHINASFFSKALRTPAGDFGVVSAVS